jgi:hypothetical protein
VPDALFFQLTLGFKPDFIFSASWLSSLLPNLVRALPYLLFVYIHAILAFLSTAPPGGIWGQQGGSRAGQRCVGLEIKSDLDEVVPRV